MTVFQSIILGIIQGLTEFLPVSSSGHLILGASLMGLPAPGLSFSILVHVGTMLATLIMLYREIGWLVSGVLAPNSPQDRISAVNVLALLVLGSIPAAVVGFTMKDLVEKAFNSTFVASIGLIFTGTFLFLLKGRKIQKTRASRTPMLSSLNWKKAIGVGLAQAVAIIPGISRSGSTITAGLFLGMEREDSSRFSFLLSIPAVFGAALLDIKSLVAIGEPVLSAQAVMGGAASFIAGIMALAWVFRLVRQGTLYRFSYYCWIAGILGLIMVFLGRAG